MFTYIKFICNKKTYLNHAATHFLGGREYFFYCFNIILEILMSVLIQFFFIFDHLLNLTE